MNSKHIHHCVYRHVQQVAINMSSRDNYCGLEKQIKLVSSIYVGENNLSPEFSDSFFSDSFTSIGSIFFHHYTAVSYGPCQLRNVES